MKIRVYQGETFTRGPLRWSISGIIVAGLLFLTIFGQELARGGTGSIFSWSTLGNVFVILLLLGGYRRYLKQVVEQQVSMEIRSMGIAVGKKLYPYERIVGFVIEADLDTEKIKNIVLVGESTSHHIFTLADSLEHVEEFVKLLEEWIPRLSHYEQSRADRAVRKMKLGL